MAVRDIVMLGEPVLREEADEITVFDDGSQTRDFTFVKDVVAANLRSIEHGTPGAAYNVAGGSRVTLNDVLEVIGEITGTDVRIRRQAAQKGDVRNTHAATEAAERRIREITLDFVALVLG